MQLLFEGSSEFGGETGLGLLGGAVEPLATDGDAPAAHRLEPRDLHRPRAAQRRAPAGRRLLPRALVRRPARRRRPTCSAGASTARASPRSCGAATSPASSSTRRSPRPTAWRCCAGSSRSAAPSAGRTAGVILYPAIDIRDGHAVRLAQGDYAKETVYDDEPVDAARRWIEQGARFLHVVDLDGARAGRAGQPPPRRADRQARRPRAGRRRAALGRLGAGGAAGRRGRG